MSAQHLILGAGQVGPEIARQLAAAGESVAIATRSGRDPGIPGVDERPRRRVRPERVRAAAAGARVAYFACQPAYTDWPQGLPAARGGRARRPRAGPAPGWSSSTTSTCTGRPGDGRSPRICPGRRPRARVPSGRGWRHGFWRPTGPATSRSRSVGPATSSVPGRSNRVPVSACFDPVLAGKSVRVIGDPDALHSHTYLPDFARALIELGRHDEALGEVWHVPTAAAVSVAALRRDGGGRGRHDPEAVPASKPMLRLAGLFVPILREFPEMWYEFAEPFVLDSSKIERAFGLRPTPLEESVPATVEWFLRLEAETAPKAA